MRKFFFAKNLSIRLTFVEYMLFGLWLGSRLSIPQQQIDSLEGLFQDNLCEKEIDLNCNKTGWYRTIDGTCNNVIHPTWGSHMSPFRGILSPVGKEGTT